MYKNGRRNVGRKDGRKEWIQRKNGRSGNLARKE